MYQKDCSLSLGSHHDLSFRTQVKEKGEREYTLVLADHNKGILIRVNLDRNQIEHLTRTLASAIVLSSLE